jgi:polyhydroxyalkanoate synthase
MELAKAQRKAALRAVRVGCAQGDCAPASSRCRGSSLRRSAWQEFPFNLMHQSFLLMQQWMWNATNHVRGVSRHHERMVTFTARQALDVASPTNYIWTNPEVLARTLETGGQNLVQGVSDWWADALSQASGKPRADGLAFTPGEQVAITPGKVVLRIDQ